MHGHLPRHNPVLRGPLQKHPGNVPSGINIRGARGRENWRPSPQRVAFCAPRKTVRELRELGTGTPLTKLCDLAGCLFMGESLAIHSGEGHRSPQWVPPRAPAAVFPGNLAGIPVGFKGLGPRVLGGDLEVPEGTGSLHTCHFTMARGFGGDGSIPSTDTCSPLTAPRLIHPWYTCSADQRTMWHQQTSRCFFLASPHRVQGKSDTTKCA